MISGPWCGRCWDDQAEADEEDRGIACWALIEHDDVQSIIPGVGSAEWSCVDLAACRCRNVIGIMPPGDTYDSWEQASADWFDRAQPVPVEEAE